MAPELKDQDDVKVVYRELKQYQLLREETELLIDECKKDVQALKDKGYGDMIIQYGNPWYNYDDRGSYLEKIDESILASFEPRCEFYKPFEDSAGSDALTKNKNWLKRATGKDKDLSENEKKQICGKLGMSNSRLVCEIYDSYNPQEYWSEVVENPENHYTYGNAFIKFWRWLVGKGEDDIARWKQTGCRWVINEKTYVQEYEALLNVW